MRTLCGWLTTSDGHVMSVCIGIILIQHDNDNEKLDFFVTKSAVDSLVES